MKKNDVDDLEKLEEYYKKSRKIKFNDEIKINEIEDIYLNFFNQKSYGFPTNQETFFKRGKLQCKKGKYRSIDDFIIICKNYFPDMTVKHILTYLIGKELILKANRKIQTFNYCPNIRKYNFRGLINYNEVFSIKNYNFTDVFPKFNIEVNKIINF